MEKHPFSRGDGSKKNPQDIFLLKTDACRTTSAKRIVKIVCCKIQLLR